MTPTVHFSDVDEYTAELHRAFMSGELPGQLVRSTKEIRAAGAATGAGVTRVYVVATALARIGGTLQVLRLDRFAGEHGWTDETDRRTIENADELLERVDGWCHEHGFRTAAGVIRTTAR